ncbi:MAG: hypothetical protein PHQ89_03395 [Bacilli bacterium]|nr:hypothetical protein [Bacilli bacterium]
MKHNKMLLFQCLLFLFVIGIVYFGVLESNQSSQKESTTQIEKALDRAISECYSIEGEYPQTLDYLLENYHVYIDEDKYLVHYIYEAGNIRPDVLITRKETFNE